MNTNRNGKIAHIPLHLRENLNRRLQDGEQGKKLVAWLNSLPEVSKVIDTEFGGRPVNEQNLTEWRQGGYRDWLALQEGRATTARLHEEIAACGDDASQPLTETLARWLVVRYAVATRQLVDTEGPEHLRLLRSLSKDVMELRRGDHSAKRLELERTRTDAVVRDAEMKWKTNIIMGLERLELEIRHNPDARAAFQALCAICMPFDRPESE